MNIFGWPAADDGCAWWRLTTPATVLRQLGHHVRTSRYAAPSWIAAADTIIAQRVVNPGPTLRWREWNTNGKFLVFDLDDHLEQLDPTSGEAYRYFNDPDNLARLHANLRRADRITAATPALADWVSHYNTDVVVIPNGLPANLLNRPRPVNERTVIGWAGSIHTLPELAIVAPHLRTILDRNPGRAQIHIVGIHPDPKQIRPVLTTLNLDHPAVHVTPWAEPGLPYLNGINFDIWVAPYRPIPFNAAKVPTKAIEAAVLGIPLIASNVGAYPTTVHHGQTGLIVRKPTHWVRYLQNLINDPDQRTAMATAARREAVHHIVEGIGPQWEKALTP